MSTTSLFIAFEYRERLMQIELNVDYEISGYEPAQLYLRNGDPGNPAEAGDVEFCAEVVRWTFPDGETPEPLNLTQVQASLDKRLATSLTLREQIEEHCRQEATDRAQDRYLDPD
jgi:hypothetical protein